MNTPILHALIVDDEAELRKSIASILNSSIQEIQFQIEEAENGANAIEKILKKDYDLVLMDVRMPEMDGLEALKKIKEHDPQTFVVILTAHSNLQDAVIAIREGAYDYIEKPIQSSRLVDIVRKSLEAKDLVSTISLSNPIFDDDVDSEIIGSNTKMKEVFNLIYKLSKVDTTVLVRGENGTGKELIAKAIHFNSHRKNGDFVAVNCGAIPESLIESELFGHEKGSFTGAIDRKIGKFQFANNGTLFLDEIGELKPELQVKLLRVLQEKKFIPIGSNREVKSNARIIAATNRNLEKMIEDTIFREDLFYRLNVMPIFLPPLRDRIDDIPALVTTFIKKFSRTMNNSHIKNISPEALELLKKYRWPGNIRELENFIERAFIIENSDTIQAASLPENVRNNTTQVARAEKKSAHEFDFEMFKEQAEKDFIVNALKANKGKINQTVARANIPKNTLLRKIKKYNINVKEIIEASSEID